MINRSLGKADLLSQEDVESFLGMRALLVLPEDTARCRRLADEGRPIAPGRSPLVQGIDSLARGLALLRTL